MSRLLSILSVVVIGRNEGPRLESCLTSVRAMHSGGWQTEFIYVDSGSTDNSLQIASECGFQAIPLVTPRPTAARGRNTGWRAATGEFVLFLDGDTILDPEFALRAIPFFDDASTAVVWGHRRELQPKHSIYNRVLDLDWVYAPGWTPFCGGDALFRRSLLEKLQGFDESLIAGEEPELCRRILAAGSRILHIDQPMTKHDLAIRSFGSYWSRAERAGHAYAEVAARFASSANPFWRDEVARNRKRAIILMTALPLGILVSLLLRSLLPASATAGILALLSVRTAWRARWKSKDPITLLFYGIHSHLQQIPIFFGQLRFQRNRNAGRNTSLLEYK